ncbi:MAG: tetratricopeptide repeat protein [Anaerolineales bacterium]|nr:tetratricopeptide repeat protein [Anaerolineales bacterium]
MYLRGSKLNVARRRRKPSNPLKLILLVGLIGSGLYLNYVVVPTIPSPFIPTPTATRSPESIINEAEDYFEQGKLAQSVEAYQQAILVDPRNPANFIALARVQIYTGQYEQASINADNALLLNPNNSLAHTMKGWALDFLGDYLEAEAAVKKAIELDPNNALAYAVYAEILIDRGNFEDLENAISLSRKAQDLAPNSLETHRIRGYVQYATTNYTEAIQEYKAAIAINDRLWELHYSLGVVYRITGEYDLAVQELLAAAAFNPNNPDIYTEISRIYLTLGQFGKAVQFAEQALATDPSNPRLYGNLGAALYKNGDYESAINSFALAVHGGTTAEGIPVQGLPLAPGRIADDYYSLYALALTKTDQCGEAIPIMRLILSNIAEDQTAYYNAIEGMNYCREALGTPAPEATPEP